MLYLWSVPSDIVERYEIYLMNDSVYNITDVFLLQQRYYNYTLSWFGPLCQFKLYFNYKTFTEEVNKRFEGPFPTSNPTRNFSATNDTCYTTIICDYLSPLSTCLDWRELCDGKKDCLNGRIDEQNCFELELNERNNDGYLCRNGRCIPAIFIVMIQYIPIVLIVQMKS
jgi:hypothetical protein